MTLLIPYDKALSHTELSITFSQSILLVRGEHCVEDLWQALRNADKKVGIIRQLVEGDVVDA